MRDIAVTHLDDYRPPPRTVQSVDLSICLDSTATRVHCATLFRELNLDETQGQLTLDGRDLTLCSIRLDGTILKDDEFVVTGDKLVILKPPRSAFALAIETIIRPSENRSGLGLFLLGDVFCTQCEPEGFRRITYFLDRPDILGVFTTRIEADAAAYPILLSNGECLDSGLLEGGSRAFAVWRDPVPKPSYLFAVVAGDLDRLQSQYHARTGRKVTLQVLYPRGSRDRSFFAMQALQRAIAWDENVFSREYDLTVYNMVAVPGFRGAMENKSLNIFNEQLLLASSESAVDQDFERIEATIAHEYFHNWTGNRITCRDWFQLGLKEGLTLYREQEFICDLHSRVEKRIHYVSRLLKEEFGEEDSPLARPVVPDSYEEVQNLYSSIAYEKGAEIVRMLETFCGRPDFLRRMDIFFNRFDGTAITVMDFLEIFTDIVDVEQFYRWYKTLGPPTVFISSTYSEASGALSLEVRQESVRRTNDEPLLFPLIIGCYDIDGTEMPHEAGGVVANETCLTISRRLETFELSGLRARPLLSVNRGFSAPIIVEVDVSLESLALQAAKDPDLFNRWTAVQALYKRWWREYELGFVDVSTRSVATIIPETLGKILADERLEPALKARFLCVPAEAEFMTFGRDLDPNSLHRARESICRDIGEELSDGLQSTYAAMREAAEHSSFAVAVGQRALQNACLRLIAHANEALGCAIASAQYAAGRNITDRLAALGVLVIGSRGDLELLADFYARYADSDSVVDKWFAIQATAPVDGTPARVSALTRHVAFSFENLTRVRALIGTFANENPTQFNRADGKGYELVIAAALELDRFNPPGAAGLLRAFRGWPKLEPKRAGLVESMLAVTLRDESLSNNAGDILRRLLQRR